MTEIEFIERKSIFGFTYTNEFPRKIPSTWEELTKAQLIVFGKTITSDVDSDDLRKYSLLFHFLKIPSRVFFQIQKEILNEIYLKLSFLMVKCELEKVIIPSFWFRGVLYVGPMDKFATNVMLETGWMEQFFRMYHETKKAEDLDLLIATTYRPIHFLKWLVPWIQFNDRRVPFNMRNVEKRAQRIKNLPAYLKQSIFLQLMGIRNSKASEFKNVYNKGSESKDRFGWLGLMIDLAGSKFGNEKEIEKVNTDKVLVYLEKSETERSNSK
jgi:hypothetical protein